MCDKLFGKKFAITDMYHVCDCKLTYKLHLIESDGEALGRIVEIDDQILMDKSILNELLNKVNK